MSDAVQQRLAPKARLRIEDRRQLGFPNDALLDALLALDHQRHGWLWRAANPTIHVEGGEPTSVSVEARRLPDAEPERIVFDLKHIAAAMIHYCWLEHIPIPRNARKEVKLSPEGAVLLLSQTISV